MSPDNCRPVGMTPQPIGKPPLEQSVVMLDAAVDFLQIGLNELYSRLEPVLAKSPDKAQSGPVACAPGNCLVVEKLHAITTRLELMNEALSSVRARVEV